jgi:4'-phosphopantetheinyl transferase
MDVHWLEQTESDVPAGNQWLSAREQSRLSEFRFEKRRRDWRLGRWTAKRVLASCLNLSIDSLVDLEIRPADSGAPDVFLFNQIADVSLSVSHRAEMAFCVVGLSRASVGCDLELVEPREHSFIEDFFTADEQRMVDRLDAKDQPFLTSLLWSAKESGLKALHVGLRLDTKLLDASRTPTPLTQRACKENSRVWSPLFLECATGQILSGWWRYSKHMVRTIVRSSCQDDDPWLLHRA